MPLSGMEQTVVLSKVPVFFDVFWEVYMEIIQDSCGLIAHWVCSSLGESDAWVGENYTIGFVEGGKLVGGLIFNNYRPNHDVWWTIYTNDKRWCCRKVLRFIFDMAFNVLKCRRISLLVSVSNKACLNLVKKLGFKIEGRLRAFRENGEDAFVLSILNSESLWS